MTQKNLRTRILFGNIILMAVIGSMAAILVQERHRMQEIELESVEISKIRKNIGIANTFINASSV